MNLRIVKATSTDIAAARNERELVDRVWRLSDPPTDLGTKATIPAKMYLGAEALVRLKMFRSPCASGPFPTSASSSGPDFTAYSVEPSVGPDIVETPKLDESPREDSVPDKTYE